ncbi:MAG: DUF6457 domain-containing protein [Gaiellaceae bacterium]
MDAWLEEARARLAAAVSEEPAHYGLTQADVDELLELARVAAHESGERINAPLLCYLVGLAHGRHGGSLSDLVAAAVGASA